MAYTVTKYENYHKTVVDKYENYAEAKAKVEELARLHRVIYGSDNTISCVENSASRTPYKVEIREMTHEAGLVVDLFYVERDLDER